MRRFFIVLCLLSIYLNGCSSLISREDPKDRGPLPELTCVAVPPTTVPVSGSETLTTTQKANLLKGATYLDSILSDELGNRVQFKMLTEHQLDAILGNPWGGMLQQVRAVGQATRCGAVLNTSISKYRQRVGGTMSIKTPAAAAFSIELLDVENGVVIWASSFDESQKSLLENLFSFNKAERRGFKWLTVEELSRDGMKSRLTEFPYFQNDEE